MKISVITINRNNLSGLKATYKSIVSQTYKDWEWIVIDGGSTEGDRDFLEEHSDEITYWCSESDSGVYNAQNKGINHAHGEWMIFMNSGDKFHDDDVLSRVFFEEHTSDILYGNWDRIYEDGHIEKMRAPEHISLHFLYRDNICHQAIFVRSTVMKNSPYDETYKIYADWAKWVELMLKKCTFEYLPICICDFSVGGFSSTMQDYADIEKKIMQKKEFPPAITDTVRIVLDQIDNPPHPLSVEVDNIVRQRNTYRRIIRFALFLCSIVKKLHKDNTKEESI